MSSERGPVGSTPGQLSPADPMAKRLTHQRLNRTVPLCRTVESTALGRLQLFGRAAVHGQEGVVGVDDPRLVVDYRDTFTDLFGDPRQHSQPTKPGHHGG